MYIFLFFFLVFFALTASMKDPVGMSEMLVALKDHAFKNKKVSNWLCCLARFVKIYRHSEG